MRRALPFRVLLAAGALLLPLFGTTRERVIAAEPARLTLGVVSTTTTTPDVADQDAVTIVLVGDTGLGGHLQPVDPRGAYRHGANTPWSDLTANIAADIDGDLNFANLESVVTDRNTLAPEDKTFVFRSHPEGIRHLAGIGFNLLSTANNHSMDYGVRGVEDTLFHLDRLVAEGKVKAHAGLGLNRDDAGRPRLVEVKSAGIALSAIGIVSGGFPHHRAGPTRPGQLAFQSAEDFDEATRRLADAPADYRILSVHQGEELSVQVGVTAIQKLRRIAVKERGIDLVVGHHAHVATGVELVDGRVIFYGLGNFLHPGMQNMSGFGQCRDYGLLARVHLRRDEAGRLGARAVEVVPLTDMHAQVRRLDPRQAAIRIHVLNHLARQLDDAATGATGIRFAPQLDGTGLFCMPGASRDPGRIGRLCADWQTPAAPPPALASAIAGSCGGDAARLLASARSGATSTRRARLPDPPTAAGTPAATMSVGAARAMTAVANAP